MAEIFARILDQRDIAHAGLEVTPDVIEVHAPPPRDTQHCGRHRDKRNVVIDRSAGRMDQDFAFSSGSSTGLPDFFHSEKPPRMWATGFIPM